VQKVGRCQMSTHRQVASYLHPGLCVEPGPDSGPDFSSPVFSPHHKEPYVYFVPLPWGSPENGGRMVQGLWNPHSFFGELFHLNLLFVLCKTGSADEKLVRQKKTESAV
jgi:hypothetical protein